MVYFIPHKRVLLVGSLESKMLKKIKLTFKQSKVLSRSLLWQILAIWQSRRKPLSTIYKHEKLAAIRQYLRADREYIKVKREINTFKTKDGYNFGGIKLPPCVITPDYFLNVFKPHMEHVPYEKESITEFYQRQKDIYPTLIYCKDVCVHGEPKYVGAHMVSHGFTYFFNEVIISEGDVVIDLGAAPGDFAALCMYYGASKLYAFEPEESKKSDMEQLSAMNDNKIEIIRKYVGLKTDVSSNTQSLDDFVAERGLSRVDFIKADIEGYEADTLRGAVELLRKFKPKLTICSYHLENDPDELCSIIVSANPEYKIYKENGVIYAY